MLILVAANAALALAAIAGWLLVRRRSSTPEPSPAKVDQVDQREQVDNASDGHKERDAVRELRRQLRAEQSLLDGVAAANGVSPRDFRRSLATEYLHAADPYRWQHLQGVVDVHETDADGSESPNGIAFSNGDSADGDQLARQLADKEAELDRTRLALTELRCRVETLLEHRRRQLPAMPGDVIDLREEVAELRSQMADRAIEADRLRVAVSQRTEAEFEIEAIVDQLTVLRERVLELRPSDQAK